MTKSPPQLVKYLPAEGSRLSRQDAITIGSRLDELTQEHGAVTAQIVLDDARKRGSPLHGFFNWNDKAAAEAHRLDKARFLLRSVRIVVTRERDEKPIRVRAFVKVSATDDGARKQGAGFVTVATAMSAAEHRREVVERALTELRQWRTRYDGFKELAAIYAAMDGIAKR